MSFIQKSGVLRATFIAAAFALAGQTFAAPNTFVFTGAANVSPNWDNLAQAVSDTDANGTVTVSSGTYTIASTITITNPINIMGPKYNIDPRTFIGTRPSSGTGGYTIDASEASFASTQVTMITISANNVVINGLDFETQLTGASKKPLIKTDGTTTRDNVVVSYCSFRQTAPSNTQVTSLPGASAVYLNNTTNSRVEYISTRNLSGVGTSGLDWGVIAVDASTNTQIQYDEVRNTGAFDRVSGIIIGPNTAESNLVVSRNRMRAPSGENIGKNGIMADSFAPSNTITISNNTIDDFEQAGISIRRSGCIVTGNYITNNGGYTAGISKAVIYIRDTSVASVTVQDNTIENITFPAASNSAGIRLNAFNATGSGFTLNSDFDSNIIANIRDVAHANGFGIEMATSSPVNNSCATALRATNNWWGTAAGPSTPDATSTYNTQLTDACDGITKTQATGAGDGLGAPAANGTGVAAFANWAYFRGVRDDISAAASATNIPGLNTPPAGNDRYSKHAFLIPGLNNGATTPVQAIVWPSFNRHGVNNSADFSLSPAVSTTGNTTVTVEYYVGTETFGTVSIPSDVPVTNDESRMRLAMWNGSSWVEQATTLDTVNNTVSGSVASLGQYAAVEDLTSVSLDLNGAGGGTDNTGVNFVQNQTTTVSIVTSDATVNTPASQLTSITATLESIPNGVSEGLTANTGATAITASYDSGTGVLTLSGTDTVANYRTVLRTVQYFNTAGSLDLSQRTVTFLPTDSGGPGSSSVSTINPSLAVKVSRFNIE